MNHPNFQPHLPIPFTLSAILLTFIFPLFFHRSSFHMIISLILKMMRIRYRACVELQIVENG